MTGKLTERYQCVDSDAAGDTWALEGDLTIQVDTADTLESRAGPGVVQVRDSHNQGL